MKLHILNQLRSFYFGPGKSKRLTAGGAVNVGGFGDSVLNRHKLSGYLKVFDVREGDSNGDHGPGVVIGEVQPFAHFSSAHSDQQSAACTERIARRT